jgi:hypothetical protein
MKCMNLEGHSGRVSLDELFDLRRQFEEVVSPKSRWMDCSIEGDGFNIVFPYAGKVFFLRCECVDEDKETN